MPPSSVTTASTKLRDWDAFVHRFGVTAVIATLAGIDVTLMVRNADMVPSVPLAATQLLLVLIVMACIAVLSHRSTGQPGEPGER